MSLTIGGSNNIAKLSLNTNNSANLTVSANAGVSSTATKDSLALSHTAQSVPPLPEQAGGWKKFSNSVGEVFSNVADTLGFGETYQLIRNEYNQVDVNRSGALDRAEFNFATLNLFDWWGTEFAKADKNRNGAVELGEYADYRKQQLSYAFDRKERTNDRHLNVHEVGFIGQQMLVNKDPRLDANQDGLVNKREFIRSVVKGTMNIREFLGF